MHDDGIGKTADGDDEILRILHKRLESFGLWKFGNRIYATESYQDRLQKIIVRVWQRRLWERLPSKDVYLYSCKALVNCIRDAWRLAKRTDLLVKQVEVISASKASTSAVARSFGVQQELEWAAEVEWVKSLFQGDNTMLTYIEKLSLGKKRKEIANEMKLTPRQVTDLDRKLKRTVKRHLKGRG